jgi:hypothetical protein
LSDKGIFLSALLAIVIVNAAGFLLNYYGLNAYIILVGFRFYVSTALPIFFVFRYSQVREIKESLLHPVYNKTFQPLNWILLPSVLLIAALFLLKKIAPGDPDYFYELGLSSVIDYPIYFIWNLPQLLMFALFLIFIQTSLKQSAGLSFIIAVSLFWFEFVQSGEIKVNYFDLASLIFIVGSAVLLVKYFQNVYWFSIIMFTALWSSFLAFGTNSSIITHMLFAARYDSWDGFFEVDNNIRPYLITIQLGLTLLLISISALYSKRKLIRQEH